MEIRFGDFVREVSLRQTEISFNDLSVKPETGPDGKEIPIKPLFMKRFNFRFLFVQFFDSKQLQIKWS